MENLTALRQKLVFTMEARNVGSDRVVNIDETAVRAFAAHIFLWVVDQREKFTQLQSGKAVVTATVAVPMAEETPAWLQVIFQGKTHSVIPKIDEATLGDRVQLTRTLADGGELAGVCVVVGLLHEHTTFSFSRLC